MEKVCFKSDMTQATGKKIIATLERMGGRNKNGFIGYALGDPLYYYINADGNITHNWNKQPDGYRLASLDEFDKPLPMRMLVSDDNMSWSERIVIHIADWYCITVNHLFEKEYEQRAGFACSAWRYCKELPTDSTEKQQLEKELTELKAKVAEMEETVKKMK